MEVWLYNWEEVKNGEKSSQSPSQKLFSLFSHVMHSSSAPSKYAKASSNHDIRLKAQDLCSTVGPDVALFDSHISKQKDNLSPYRPTYNCETGIRNNNKLCSGHQPIETLQSYYESIDQFPLGLGAFLYDVGPVTAPETHAPVHCSWTTHSASGMTLFFLHPSWSHLKRVLENLSRSIIYLGS